MMAWQTIDTAPMDGTLVLVAATRRPRVIPVGARYIEGEGWLARKFCSAGCARLGGPTGPRSSALARIARRAAERASALRRVCPWCLNPFVAATLAQRFCSRHCQNALKFRARKAMKRQCRGDALTLGALGIRDRWVCGLCLTRVDRTLRYPAPGSPSIDHIVPLSLGGNDAAANQQLAHLRCNLKKRSNRCGSQLRLL
jgi:hypothetical protein